MKDYYDVLDIPVTATLDEIKAQYRRLVKIYHPDRFTNSLDKVYAEHKLKELNEAYSVLSAHAKTADANEPSRPMPIPLVEPAILEFGSLAVGQRHTVKFKVGNAGGPTNGISFVYHDDHAWYSITKVRQVYPDKSFPVEIEVIVNPGQLEPSRKYQSWFDVNMDGATSRVELRLQTTQAASSFRLFSHRLALVTATCCLILAFTLALPWARSLTVAFGLPAVNPLIPAQLTEKMNTPAQAVGGEGSTASLEWAPVFSPDKRQVAFISSQLGESQIFIRDPLSGRLRQVTQGTAEKLALRWSPDSSQLAFITRTPNQTAVEIFTLADGHNVQVMLDINAGELAKLLWAPDGESIYLGVKLAEEEQVYQVNTKSQTVAQVSTPAGWQ